jgi:hypothetical protein
MLYLLHIFVKNITIIMNEIEFTGGEMRLLAYNKLKVFLANPGMFCLVVLGTRGTGKNFAIEKAFNQIIKNNVEEDLRKLRLLKLNFLSAFDFFDSSEDLDKYFHQHIGETVVIDDFEVLNEGQIVLLLEALSTFDGNFGIEKKVEIRIIFTSSQPLGNLRFSGNSLSMLLWDRISQLIVELPSFQQEGKHIKIDFENTWEKMNFGSLKNYEGLDKIPGFNGLRNFLDTSHKSFAGGFRDLDKIACLYFNYRIFHYGEKRKIDINIEEKVLKDVKADFLGKTQLTEEVPTANNLFDFNDVKPSGDNANPSLHDFNNQFRIQFRKWLIEKHKTLIKAAKSLNCSIHTFKNYK